MSLEVLRERVRGKSEDKSNDSFKSYLAGIVEASLKEMCLARRVGRVRTVACPTLAYMKSILFKQGKPGGKKGRPNHRL